MKIIFMGTPSFAVCSLQALIEGGHEIVGVFTKPDRQKGRGHQLAFSPVKTYALQNDLNVFQPETLKGEENCQLICDLQPEVIVVVAYGKILPATILDIPPHGCINVHGSLLPLYRGAAPIQWSVLNGDSISGVTTMYMAKGVDTGDMLLKSQVDVGKNETSSELYDRLAVVGAELLIETLKQLEAGTLERKKQNDDEATYAPLLTKDMSLLDFTKSAIEIHHQICGLSDWPCAVMMFHDKRLKVYKSEVVELTEALAPGEQVKSKELIIACGSNTAIKLIEVQYEGSKRMPATAFLAGAGSTKCR